MKYIVITVDDARWLARSVDGCAGAGPGDLVDRLRTDTGGDIQEIADTLKKQRICAACSIEGVPDSCQSIGAQALGRRLNRLLERARGERK